MYKYNKVISDPFFDKLYLQLEVESQKKKINILDFTLEFMRETKKSTLVITGLSGAGKSTFIRHLERSYLINWKNLLNKK